MAPNATICKAVLHIADVDRQYYEDHSITLARHPSETDERIDRKSTRLNSSH